TSAIITAYCPARIRRRPGATRGWDVASTAGSASSGWRFLLMFIVDPPLLHPKLNEGDGENHDEQQPRHGRGVAHAVVAEGVTDDVGHDDFHLPVGGAVAHRHQPHLVKNLKRVDEQDNDDEEHG